jgi:hypothetical protein
MGTCFPPRFLVNIRRYDSRISHGDWLLPKSNRAVTGNSHCAPITAKRLSREALEFGRTWVWGHNEKLSELPIVSS